MRPCDTPGDGEAQPYTASGWITRDIAPLERREHTLESLLGYAGAFVFHEQQRILAVPADATMGAAPLFHRIVEEVCNKRRNASEILRQRPQERGRGGP